jgi:hydrogenase/urease accessory protein HupE
METVSWHLRVRLGDLALALHLGSGSGGISDARWPRERAESYLRDGLHVWRGGDPCAIAGSSLASDPSESEPTVIFVQRYRCPANGGPLRLGYDLFFESDRFHQSFTRLTLAASAGIADRAATLPTVVFRDGLREIVLGSDQEPSVWRNALVYLRLGVVHILTGYDHLSFLMALLLGAALRTRTTERSDAAAAPPRQAIWGTAKVISAFTVAHSITLIVQVLRPGWISTRWVEPAIALSVAYVGFENLIPRPPRHRWLLVFGFGLVHGLGFASVLQEIGLPRRGLVLSLLSFNVGVELGQLLVLAVTFPLIIGAARSAPRRFERWGLQLGSGVIAAFGTVWLVARLASR